MFYCYSRVRPNLLLMTSSQIGPAPLVHWSLTPASHSDNKCYPTVILSMFWLRLLFRSMYYYIVCVLFFTLCFVSTKSTCLGATRLALDRLLVTKQSHPHFYVQNLLLTRIGPAFSSREPEMETTRYGTHSNNSRAKIKSNLSPAYIPGVHTTDNV